MNVEIKKLGEQDIEKFKELILVFEDVFEMKHFKMPGEDHLQQLLNNDSFFVFVASLHDKVVGGLTAYSLLQYYSALPLVYLYDLAVTTAYQRKGIGKLLILGITGYCREIGVEEMFVQASEEDGHAIEFYHSTGATAEKVVHFNYSLQMERH